MTGELTITVVLSPDQLQLVVEAVAARVLVEQSHAPELERRYLSGTRAAAQYLGLSPSTLKKLVATGDVPCARPGGDDGRSLLFDTRDLDDWVTARKTGRLTRR